MLGFLGYDVTTFGNHEYDYRSKGLVNMLKAAVSPVRHCRHWLSAMWIGTVLEQTGLK